MKGKSLEEYKLKIQADLKTAVMGSWAVWVRKNMTFTVLHIEYC